MNERIKQLADQMFSMEQFEYAEEFIDHEFMEKFAELIVKQCGEISAFGDPRYSAQHNIHKYFGVE